MHSLTIMLRGSNAWGYRSGPLLVARRIAQKKKALKSRHSAVFRALILRIFGRGDRIRTCDFYVPNVALYQAELHPVGAAYLNVPSRAWQQVVGEFSTTAYPARF
jgi:hypothetical protein